MTNYEKILEFLRDNPTATNKEIAKSTGVSIENVKTGISRLTYKGFLDPDRSGETRTITVVEQPPISKNEYKKNIVENMIDRYMEDFENCEILTDRIEVGKIILKLLERL